ATQKLSDKQLLTWLPVIDEDCRKVHVLCQKILNGEVIGIEFPPKMTASFKQIASHLESAEKLNPSKVGGEVLTHLRSEIYEINRTIDLKSSLDLREKLQNEFEMPNAEMPPVDALMQPLSGWHFQNLNPVNTLEPISSQWQLNSVRNISLAALYTLGSSGLAAFNPTGDNFASTEQGFEFSHQVEIVNTAALPEPLEKINVTIHTREPFENTQLRNELVTPKISPDIEELIKGNTRAETALAAPLPLPQVSTNSILARPSLITLAAQSASVNQLHTFLASNSAAINPVIFAHLIGHANPMIEKTQYMGKDLEGAPPFFTISYQLEVAKAMLQAMQQVPIGNEEFASLCCGEILGDPLIADSVKNNPKLLEDLVRQLQIAQYIEQAIIADSSVYDYRGRIIENVEKLSPGQSFFFAGGWRTKDRKGHAISWTVTKQMNGKLTVRLHNTGEGMQSHFSEKIGLQERFLLFTEIEDVDPEQFTGGSFLQGVFNIRTVELPNDVVDWGAHDIYGPLLLGMGGSSSLKQYAMSELAQPQFVGICAMESIMEAIGTTVKSETSAILYRFWATFKGTVSFFDQIKDSLVEGAGAEEQRRLLHDGLKVLSNTATKALEAGTLTDRELEYTSTMIKQMNQHLKQMESKASINNAEKEPVITFQVPSHFLQSKEQFPNFYSSGQVENEREMIRPLIPINVEVFSANPATLVNDLQNLLQEVHLGNHKRHNYLEVQRA
ncbi:MAG: hypothetical protein H0X29_12090, partial [Parachlamydiaceae bacterium]|nr:hypothetical protein [Parachlamydiaceae bacterium]